LESWDEWGRRKLFSLYLKEISQKKEREALKRTCSRSGSFEANSSNLPLLGDSFPHAVCTRIQPSFGQLAAKKKKREDLKPKNGSNPFQPHQQSVSVGVLSDIKQNQTKG
jgi:hypothetical protein